MIKFSVYYLDNLSPSYNMKGFIYDKNKGDWNEEDVRREVSSYIKTILGLHPLL